MNTVNSARRKPLRLWPGVAAVVLQWTAWLLPVLVPEWGMYSVLGGMLFGLVVLVWWLFFSRARWYERPVAIGVMVAAVAATSLVVHPSVSNGFMGNMLYIYSVPVLSLALVIWAAASRNLSGLPRYAALVAAVVIACGTLTLIRTDGISGEGVSDLEWRWTPTHEEQLLARGGDVPLLAPPGGTAPSAPPPAAVPAEPAPSATGPAAATIPGKDAAPEARPEPAAIAPDPAAMKAGTGWPGFRGPNRDSVIRGLRIETDWTSSPPAELWRRPIGPGWSSFAVDGDLVYTQEQRGEEEIVSCYRLATGEPVWMHTDPVRFWESNGGAGPRGTPTVRNGRVYTMGATGIVNVLDARTGSVVWSRDAAADTGVETPGWGFASSPLVLDDLVIVAASGRLAAYELATGRPRWLGPAGGGGYSSPHLATIGGVPQVMLLRGARTISVAPADGTVLWEHSSGQPSVSIVQPAVAANGDVLIAAGDAMGGLGMRRVAVAKGAGGWTVEERWTSRGLKPYFNDFVVHEGHAFGFDGSILSCVNLEDGERAWKGGRYGHGQLLLLPEQDLLLVLSEEGELALVGAGSERFTEVARFKAIEGKTWNHPVLIGDVLLVRNGEEMAAFRLALASR